MRRVGLNGEPHTVVGVLAAGFEFETVEIWTPFVVRTDQEPVDGGLVLEAAFQTIGRLQPEVSPEQAATEVRRILDRTATERRRPPDLNFGTRVISLREEMGRPFRPALLMLTDHRTGARSRPALHLKFNSLRDIPSNNPNHAAGVASTGCRESFAVYLP